LGAGTEHSFDLGPWQGDHPLGFRFEEMDAIVVFDAVPSATS
jgi:aromatic ring hydroxylase